MLDGVYKLTCTRIDQTTATVMKFKIEHENIVNRVTYLLTDLMACLSSLLLLSPFHHQYHHYHQSVQL